MISFFSFKFNSIIKTKPKVANISDTYILFPDLTLLDNSINSFPYMVFTIITAKNAPTIWANIYLIASLAFIFFKIKNAIVTAGLKCAPEYLAKELIKTNKVKPTVRACASCS